MEADKLRPGTWIRWDDDTELGLIVQRIVLMGGKTVRYGVVDTWGNDGRAKDAVSVSVNRVSSVVDEDESLLLDIKYGR